MSCLGETVKGQACCKLVITSMKSLMIETLDKLTMHKIGQFYSMLQCHFWIYMIIEYLKFHGLRNYLPVGNKIADKNFMRHICQSRKRTHLSTFSYFFFKQCISTRDAVKLRCFPSPEVEKWLIAFILENLDQNPFTLARMQFWKKKNPLWITIWFNWDYQVSHDPLIQSKAETFVIW